MCQLREPSYNFKQMLVNLGNPGVWTWVPPTPDGRGSSQCSLPRWPRKRFWMNESSRVTHAGSHIWQSWVTSLMVLSVLRVPGNTLPKVKCTSCSNRLSSHASLRHSDGHKLWGLAPALSSRGWAGHPPGGHLLSLSHGPKKSTKEVKFHAWRCPGQDCMLWFSTLIK